MSTVVLGALSVVAVIVMIFLGMPVGFSMAFIAFAGMLIISGFTPAMGMMATTPLTSVANYDMITIPLFLLMGTLAFNSGVVADAYESASKWLGNLRGGLSIATIVACTAFAACTGSSATSVGLITITALPEMEKRKYSPALAAGSIASGCTLGILIPPSVPMIVYALIAGESIGKLFMAGILPGLLMASLFIITIVIWIHKNPSAGPAAGHIDSLGEKVRSLKPLWAMLLLILLVIGGIWGGIFTPIEAGGIGAFGAFAICLIRRRLTWRKFINSLTESVMLSAMVFALMIGALMLNGLLAQSRLTIELAKTIGSLSLPPLSILIIIMLFWLVGGCIMDSLGLMLITLPIFVPIIKALDMNLIWFGVLMVIMIEAAEITPPVGINVFVLCGIAKHIPMYTVFKGIVPFVVAMVVCLTLIIAFPQIALFLPQAMHR